MGYLRKAALWTCLPLTSVLLLVAVGSRTQRYILRHRAEMLLADMQSINLRQTTFHDVEPIMARWQRWGTYDGPCSESHCSFAVHLSELDTPLNRFTLRHSSAFAVATFLGQPPVAIHAYLTVVDGIVWDEGIAFGIETQEWSPDGRRYVDLISGSARTVPKLDMGWGPHWHLHPDYNIYWAANQQNQIQLEFSPFANSNDVHRLMAFNFSCLTRFDPCQDKKEIMPLALAEREYWVSLPDDPTEIESECDDATIEIFGRDSRSIAVAKVLDGHVSSYNPEIGSQGYELTAALQYELKSRTRWSSLGPLKLSMSYPISATLPRPGNLVVLFSKDDNFSEYSLAGCSPLSLTTAHLDSIRRGIAEDTRPSALTE
jgi:hypothetical protein